MFDFCTKEMDFTNLEHLACTEIRAANLTYCSYLSAFVNGDIDRGKIKNQHMVSITIYGSSLQYDKNLTVGMLQECVKKRATDSVFAVRPVTREIARAAVEKVFDKCYKDLEPIGRRVYRNNYSYDLAYAEAFLHGYD